MSGYDAASGSLIDRAWEAFDRDGTEGARLARAALDQDPAEIDGFVVLALCTPCRAERVALLREGVRLGQAEHAAALADPEDHDFWADLGTRPYMRAVHNLVLELWVGGTDDGRREAARLAQHLVRINPEDHQGIRFLLMIWLPALGRWDALARLLSGYADEERTETRYARALLAYRVAREDADDLLAAAVALNPHVPALIGDGRPPETSGQSVGFRGEEEALSYAHHAHPIWTSVPGAEAWIARRSR